MSGSSVRSSTLVLLVVLLGTALAVPCGAGPERDRAVPTEEALWAAAGNAYAAGHDKSAAMQQYRLFVQSYKGSAKAASAQFMLAECYFAVEDYKAALSEYGRVKGSKGVNDYLRASVLLRQGECHFNMGDFDEAVEIYDRLIDKYDDTFLLAEGLYEIGLAYIVKGNWLKLRAAYRELLERRPGYRELPQVKFALGLFAYQEKNYDEAVGYFEQAPSDRGLYYLGRCLEDTGQYILAIQRYKQVLRQFPESPLADDVAFSIAPRVRWPTMSPFRSPRPYTGPARTTWRCVATARSSRASPSRPSCPTRATRWPASPIARAATTSPSAS